MIKLQNKLVPLTLALLIITNLSACSAFNKVGSFLGDKKTVNYENNASVKNLEFPPDLTAPEFDKAFELPTGTVSVVSMRNGVPGQQYNTIISTSSNNSQAAGQRTRRLSSVTTLDGETALKVNDTYPRALILTDIMLVRMGFSVLSRNPAGNVYRVQYNGNDVDTGQTRKGFSGWFNRTKKSLGLETDGYDNRALVKGRIYQVSIANQQGANLVRFSGDAGQSLSSAAHTKIITLLNNEFNR